MSLARESESPADGGALRSIRPLAGSYVTGTVSVSESVESSKRLRVAVVNATSVTVAVHFGFGHDPAGADAAFSVRGTFNAEAAHENRTDHRASGRTGGREGIVRDRMRTAQALLLQRLRVP
jgi:hypothetical protein